MTKTQKIIILAAATLIIYGILFPPESDFFMFDVKGNLIEHTVIDWQEIVGILMIAGAAFIVAKKRRPKGRE
jgi:hypothetical protein